MKADIETGDKKQEEISPLSPVPCLLSSRGFLWL